MQTVGVIASSPLPYGDAQLVEWHWPSPMDVVAREERHMIEMSLPPFACDGAAAFPDLAPDRFSFIGSLFVRPAGVLVRSRSAGGRIQVVRLAVERGGPAHGVVSRLAEDVDKLRAALDLREQAPRMLLRRIRDELLRPCRDSAALIRAYADALLIEIERALEHCARAARERGRLADWQYHRVCERIAAEGKAPSQAELARLCGVSTRHFSRLYRALTGESASAAIERARIGRALQLMEGSAPLKDIAGQLGFAHPAAFSHAFRRVTGKSPNVARRRVIAAEGGD